MSLSEQFASTPRPRESRLLAAAAELLRAAGWRVEAPASRAELVPDSDGNWRLQWRPDGVGEALPCDCEPPA